MSHSASSARSDLKEFTSPMASYNFRMRAICDVSDMRILLKLMLMAHSRATSLLVKSQGEQNGFDDFGCEPRALLQRSPSEGLLPTVGSFPEELVDQVPVGAVDLHEVEPEPTRRLSGATKGANCVGDVLLAHGNPSGLVRRVEAGRALDRAGRLPSRFGHAPPLRRTKS